LSRLPGWEKNSWGYHGDDGNSFAAERNGTKYGPKYGSTSLLTNPDHETNVIISAAGDVIGCGIDFSQHKVFYTKNGSLLGTSLLRLSYEHHDSHSVVIAGPAFDNVGNDCDIYPSVGLRYAGEAIRVNFGHEPFKFDIEYHTSSITIVIKASESTASTAGWAGRTTPLKGLASTASHYPKAMKFLTVTLFVLYPIRTHWRWPTTMTVQPDDPICHNHTLNQAIKHPHQELDLEQDRTKDAVAAINACCAHDRTDWCASNDTLLAC
jgi:hypothetical protein